MGRMSNGKPGHDALRLVGGHERETVLQVLCSAFQDDPLYSWLFPDVRTRPTLMRPLLEVILDSAYSGEAVWALDDLKAVAVWARDPIRVIDDETVDRYLAHLAETLSPSRMELVTQAMAASAHFVPATAHDVLHLLAVPRQAQGDGRGAALLKQLLARSDYRRRPVYLESSNDRNLTLYARHGFVSLGKVPLAGGRTCMTPMLRQAKPLDRPATADPR